MADGVDIDLYADVDHEFAQEESNYNSVDLYDDMLQPSSRASGSRKASSNGITGTSSGMQYNYQGKKVSIYIGNLTWWTTDKDLQKAISSLGVTDLIEIKFYENRTNGQSKGFALVHLQSDTSSRIIMEKLPQKDLHGQSPVVTPCNRQSLNQFEQQSKAQSGGGAPPPKAPTPVAAPPVQSPAAPQFSQPPPALPSAAAAVATALQPRPTLTSATSAMLSQPPPGMPPPILPNLSRLPPPLAVPHRRTAITVPPPGVPPPHALVPPPGMPPPAVMRSGPPPSLPHALHASLGITIPPPTSLAAVNPRIPPPLGLPPAIAPRLAGIPPPVNRPPPALPASSGDQRLRQDSYRDTRSQSPLLSEQEIEEIMVRNRAVSSSAISRAVSDASSGDYGGAIETLVTAISLIKQSKVATDERAKVLIGSLQDCLHGIEEKSFGSGGGSSRSKRDRSRDREERSRHRESKSRRRDRDRDRDRSRSRDRYDDREYRDRSRDRDSGGGSYSRHSDRDRHRR